MSWNEESSPHEPYTTSNHHKPSMSLGQENIVTRHPPHPNQIYLAAENSGSVILLVIFVIHHPPGG